MSQRLKLWTRHLRQRWIFRPMPSAAALMLETILHDGPGWQGIAGEFTHRR
ncbi:hypothetical protein [Streptomyces erythrochromogenes]|uniref:hypothetical protein n=1 Tax=Streptomyces erythrochromogenes TaxID=285574 RepID=UPI0036FC6AB8